MPAELFFPGIRMCRCGVQFWLACTLCRVDSTVRIELPIKYVWKVVIRIK